MRTELSLYVDGSRIKSEQYGNIENAEKIILFCHGFPGSNRITRLKDSLKNEPISIVEINYRGDKKSEGKFSFIGSIKDIVTVANYLKEHYRVPLHALGYSMGGFYVTNIINQEPQMFEKVILLNPVVDTRVLFSNKLVMDELWMDANNILSLKTPEDYEEEIDTVNSTYNPIGFVKRLITPMTIVQSTADEVLSPKIAKKFYASLICEKSYHEIPNAKHDLKGDEEQLIHSII